MSSRRAAGTVAAAFALGVAGLLGGCTGAQDAAPASAGASDSVATSAATPGGTTPGESRAPAEVAPTPPEPTPAIPAYTVEQLRQIVIDSGYPCTTFTPATTGTGSGAGTGGWCAESSLGVFVFPAQADVEALLARSEASSEPQPFLVGTRWVITSSNPATSGDELVSMQDIIGGSLVGPDL